MSHNKRCAIRNWSKSIYDTGGFLQNGVVLFVLLLGSNQARTIYSASVEFTTLQKKIEENI